MEKELDQWPVLVLPPWVWNYFPDVSCPISLPYPIPKIGSFAHVVNASSKVSAQGLVCHGAVLHHLIVAIHLVSSRETDIPEGIHYILDTTLEFLKAQQRTLHRYPEGKSILK